MEYFPPLVMNYDPELWIDLSEPDNTRAYVNFLQANELMSCTLGVNLPSGWGDYPHETVRLGNVEYTLYTFQQEDAETVMGIYFAEKSLVGYDFSIGTPMPMLQSVLSEWDRCKDLGEEVIATLHAYPMSITNQEAILDRWEQYEYALSAALLGPETYPSRSLGNGLCEWEIYGQSQAEVYVYAICQDADSDDGTAVSAPVVIRMRDDGTIIAVDQPLDGAEYVASIQEMFPSGLWDQVIQGRAGFTFNTQAAWENIAYRREHRGTPPQIVELGVALP